MSTTLRTMTITNTSKVCLEKSRNPAWPKADRMVNLNVDAPNFNSERDVVKEEFRQRILANPYGMLFGQYIEKRSFTTHPYKRPGIGNLDELTAATPKDAEDFYKLFYRPDNAVVIVVGDFDQAQLDGWVDKYFGRRENPGGAIPRVTEVEPERTEEKRYSETAPNVPFPAVAITYLAAPSKSPDVPAMRSRKKILSGGEKAPALTRALYINSRSPAGRFLYRHTHGQGVVIFPGDSLAREDVRRA